MKRRLTRFPAMALFTALTLSGLRCRAVPEEPNLVLITIDTLRADHLSCYGYEHPTSPTIDALAADGVLFEDAYATAPITAPSHASLLTGRYPLRHGVLTNGLYVLAEAETTLAELLSLSLIHI